MVVIIFVLTIFDILMTHRGYNLGILTEANPFMVSIISRLDYCIVMILLIGAGLYFLQRMRGKIKWLDMALWLILVVKIFIALIHIEGVI